MGTVHAKAADSAGGSRNTLGADDNMEYDEPLPKTQLKLDSVRARVDRVHVDGLCRTKDDIVKATVDEMFQATHFEDVIVKAHKVRRALDAMGCFRDIGVFIDVSDTTPEGLEVTFQVRELSRIVGGVNTTVSENEGSLVVGAQLPNALGRGERLRAEYSMGHRSSSNFSVTASKPWPHRPLVPVVSGSLYQQSGEYPTSGYRVLDRGVLLDLAFSTSPTTKHNLQWEGLVRDTSVLSKTTSFKVRESSGPQLKSLVRHIVCVDRRDDPIFPTRGARVQFSSELAGVGGGVAHLKTELQAEGNYELGADVTLQATAALGALHDMFGTSLPDRLYLGGPASVRGFLPRGLGPHCDNDSVGGTRYWAGALHVWAPLPFVGARGPLPSLFRTHLFLNVGWLGAEDSTWNGLSSTRAAIGGGGALRLGRAARLELNYVYPIPRQGDKAAPGLQFGVGAHFL